MKNYEKCEGCSKKLRISTGEVHYDDDMVPLCEECMAELVESEKKRLAKLKAKRPR